jgi:hypothetical protein
MPDIPGLSLARAAAVLLVLAAGACASVATAPSRLQGIKTVGIISAFADDFTITNAGLTGMDSTDRSVSIEPWGIDDLIVSRVGALLSQHFQVHNVTYRRAAFATRERSSSVAVVNLLRDDPVKALVHDVSPQGLDAYIVITKATSRYGSRGRPVSGLGVIYHSAVLGSYAEVHALYGIRVIDGHTFNVIDKMSASPLDNADIARLSGPSRRLAVSLRPPNDLASNDTLKAAVTDLIERSLATTLQDVRLTGGS